MNYLLTKNIQKKEFQIYHVYVSQTRFSILWDETLNNSVIDEGYWADAGCDSILLVTWLVSSVNDWRW